MFSWPVRVFGIALAGVELVLLMMNVNLFHIEFSLPFKEFMMRLGDVIAWFLRLEDIEAAIRNVLASINFHLPELGKHWHYVFVLLWLLMGSEARLLASMGAVDAPLLSGAWFRNAAIALALLAWAGVCALITAVATGIAPLNSLAVTLSPIGGCAVFALGTTLARVLLGRRAWWGMAIPLAIALAFAFVGFYVVGMVIRGRDNPGLAVLVGMVGGIGLIFGGFGLLLDGSTWRERLTSPSTAFGLDIISAYAIAFGLAAIFGKYTLS